MASNSDKPTLLERARRERLGHCGNSMWNWSNFDPECRRARLNGFNENDREIKSHDLIVIECSKHDNGEPASIPTQTVQEVRYVKDDDIPAWLDRTSRDRLHTRAGLRLIHKFHDLRTLDSPFTQQTYEAINDKLDLPDVFSHYSSTLIGANGKFMSDDSKSVTIVCKRVGGRYTISTVVRHDFETDVTAGYLLSHKGSMIHHALLGIPEQYRACSHPLLIPILMVEQMLEDATEYQDIVNGNIINIEQATGFNSYGGTEYDDDGARDYRKLSKDLGEWSARFAHSKTRLLALKAMLEFCYRELELCHSWIPLDKWEKYAESTRILSERARYSASLIEHLLIYDGLEMRLQVQQNVIFNLIAQEDNRSNIQLSEEMRKIAMKTKRDGSIVKTIAFLGTVFLPATFVSTLFAMPLFNWSAPTTSEIVGDHFWIYWAVTGPLTVTTMAIVGYWILSRAQKNFNDEHRSSDETRPSRLASLRNNICVLGSRQPFKVKDGV